MVDGEIACGDALTWKDRKCNIALITGITGQVRTFIDFQLSYSLLQLFGGIPVITHNVVDRPVEGRIL